MKSTRNESYQVGSLRIRVSAEERLDLVRYNGHDWDIVDNNDDEALQQAMRDAVPSDSLPGLYVPTPRVGMAARNFPLAA
jgi:hypothetical protein